MSDIKIKYNKCKLKVKIWESEFKKTKGRAPTKDDIREASTKVKDYYKLYWNLKVKLLENEYLNEEQSTYNPVLKDQNNILRSSESDTFEVKSDETVDVNSEICKKDDKENNCNVKNSNTWGLHLNKLQDEDETPKLSIKEPKTSDISSKLFAGSSFKKRNPRKSFNKSKSNISFISDNTSFVCDESDLSVLSQADLTEASANFTVEDDCSPKIKALIGSDFKLSPFLCKTEVSNEIQQSQPVSLLQTSMSGSLNKLKSARKLDVGWLDRVNKANNLKSLTPSSDSGFDSSSGSLASTEPTSVSEILKPDTADTSDDDFDIIDSDTESYEVRNILSVKRKFSHESADDSKTCDQGNNSNTTNVLQESPEASHEPLSKRIKIENINVNVNKPQNNTIQINEVKLESNIQEGKIGTVKRKGRMTKKDILEKKIASGTLNENFVKINLKKKVFVRGKRNFNYSKFKKQQWKNRRKQGNGDSESASCAKCFKCGDIGHFARYCQTVIADEMFGKPENVGSGDEEDSDILTLEEAEIMAKDSVDINKKSNGLPTSILDKTQLDAMLEDFNNLPDIDRESNTTNQHIPPLFNLCEDGSVMKAPAEVNQALLKFGHEKFRPGQEDAVMRIMSGKSTLVTLSTGSGKSLCYQLPAYMFAQKYNCLTLVVSPLVSLMEDQVSGSSSFFKVACLHTNMTEKQREVVMEQVTSGSLHALLVSPETIVAGEKLAGFRSLLKKLPSIAFACIDEAHCLSQWSHNFRPSYLLICQVLQDKLGINTILGLTATASKTTIASIVSHLKIDESDVIKDIPLPDNLILSVSTDVDKDRSLLELLQSPLYKESRSTLIYCTRRDQCERLATLIRTALKDFAKPEKTTLKRLSWNAEAYHAGMSAARRKQVQKAFMMGNLRIVVATVAFGMGINKPDIRAVIHYNMPKNFESYVQEVGRAGRDGNISHCHLFLDSKGNDLNELRRFIYSDAVDRFVLRKLLQRVFLSCTCKPDNDNLRSVDYCPGHEIAFDTNETIQALDLPEENILTLLCYLELHPKKWIEVLAPTYTVCNIWSYNGPKTLKLLSKHCAPLAMALAMNSNKVVTSHLTFKVVELASRMNWDSGTVKRTLKNLEWKLGNDGKWKKSGLKVEFSVLGFHVRARGNMTGSELDEALESLVSRVDGQEKTMICQLDSVFSTLNSVAYTSFSKIEEPVTRSDELKVEVRKYFSQEINIQESPSVKLQVDDFAEDEVMSDIRSLICTYRDNNFNGRAVARIFHGIQSPNYPASIWYKCRYWRAHLNKNFNKLSKIATREILRFK